MQPTSTTHISYIIFIYSVLDIMYLIETWLRDGDATPFSELRTDCTVRSSAPPGPWAKVED